MTVTLEPVMGPATAEIVEWEVTLLDGLEDEAGADDCGPGSARNIGANVMCRPSAC